LLVCESELPASDLFPKNAVFFDDIINDALLMLVQPACDTGNASKTGVGIADIYGS
jgi:hypothetical protein